MSNVNPSRDRDAELAADRLALLAHQDVMAGGRQPGRDGEPAHAGADDDHPSHGP